MKRRFRRHSRSHVPDAATREPRGVPRYSFNLLWIIFGVVVLASVIFYDQRQVQQARQHIERAAYFRQHGVYKEALNEYQRAYKNKRLGRHPKAEVALAMGDIYFDQFENYDMARTYFERAKQDNPHLFQNNVAQDRLKAASQKSVGAGVSQSSGESQGTTTTIIQRVELLNPPQEDLRGPVIARYAGGEIHAGAFLRWLKDRAEYNEEGLRSDPRRLEELLDVYLDRYLRYQGGLDAGLQRDADISARLYDYQRTLIGERYLAHTRQASVITQKQVQEYYDQHRDQYVQPATASIAAIKTNTEAEAEQALTAIRKGATFGDVATSASIDEASAARKGLIGTISENDTSITVVGTAPEIVKQLVRLRQNSVTSVIPANGSFFVFHSVRSSPGRTTTIEEARPQIEMKLRAIAQADSAATINRQLRGKYSPDISRDGLQKFWKFASGENASRSDRATTPTANRNDTATTTAEAAPENLVR